MISPVIARLKTLERQPGKRWLIEVGGLADFTDAIQAKRLPKVDFAAWVTPAGGSAGQGGRYDAGIVSQDIVDAVDVMISVRSGPGNDGELAALNRIDPLRLAIIRLLTGWKPDDAHEHLLYSRDRPAGAIDGALLWVVSLRAQWTLETLRRP